MRWPGGTPVWPRRDMLLEEARRTPYPWRPAADCDARSLDVANKYCMAGLHANAHEPPWAAS
eukprot:1580030-Lingulodinium_polyedra.AAC.1